jgi:hypothetical protein
VQVLVLVQQRARYPCTILSLLVVKLWLSPMHP